MFKNLVESTSSLQQNAKKSAYFGATAIVNATLFLGIFVWSVYSFNLSALNQNEDLDVNTLVAPAVEPEKVPPVLQAKQLKAINNETLNENFDRLRNPVLNINLATKPPQSTSTVQSDVDPVRENVPFIVSDVTKRVASSAADDPREKNYSSASQLALTKSQQDEDELKDVAPVLKPASKPALPTAAKKTIMSKGVINGIATNLPKPVYPAPAIAIRASGLVKVQVTIDESGNVTSANAIEGHPLLRAAATQAARQAKFTPTKLSEQPVKVTGVIIYNFVPQ